MQRLPASPCTLASPGHCSDCFLHPAPRPACLLVFFFPLSLCASGLVLKPENHPCNLSCALCPVLGGRLRRLENISPGGLLLDKYIHGDHMGNSQEVLAPDTVLKKAVLFSAVLCVCAHVCASMHTHVRLCM